MHRWTLRTVIFFLAFTWFSGMAKAGTTTEYKELDTWCIDLIKWQDSNRSGRTPPQPPDSYHYHHYCDSVRGLRRMYAPKDKRDFVFQHKFVLDNAKYVIVRVPPDHHLLPMVYLLMGKALDLAKHYAEAEANLLKAAQLDPQYLAVQVALANLYLGTNRKDKAMNAIRAGLDLAPDTKSLKRMAADLGMTIKPAPPKQDAAAIVTHESTQPGSASIPSTSRTENTTEQTDKAGSPVFSPITQETDPSFTSEVKIGSPTNPWCRFCPDPITAGEK